MHNSLVPNKRTLGLYGSGHGSTAQVFKLLKSDTTSKCPIRIEQVSCKCWHLIRNRNGQDTYFEVSGSARVRQ